jgi:hypothetical protein
VIDATAPQAGATATKETEPKLLRLPRIPTPLVVAVLGIVLGSWLLPAFTRQWDDRQKAGEVKAAIVAQIASASGRALLEVHQATTRPGPAPSSQRGIPSAAQEWSVASMEIRAKLRAYFGPSAVEHWTLVSQYITSSLSVAYRSRAGDAVIPNPWISRMKSQRLESLFSEFRRDRVFDGLEIAVLKEAESLTNSLLAMHVRGYSTTTRDLVADLFPS